MNPSVLSLLLFAIPALMAALPLPFIQRNIPTTVEPQSARLALSPSTLPVICSTSTASPTTLALQTALTLFTTTCNPSTPLQVDRSKACINLITTDTVIIDLCGWSAEITCAGAEQAVQSVLDNCASVGNNDRVTAAGEVEWGGSVVRVQRVVRTT